MVKGRSRLREGGCRPRESEDRLAQWGGVKREESRGRGVGDGAEVWIHVAVRREPIIDT